MRTLYLSAILTLGFPLLSSAGETLLTADKVVQQQKETLTARQIEVHNKEVPALTTAEKVRRDAAYKEGIRAIEATKTRYKDLALKSQTINTKTQPKVVNYKVTAF